jgi:hypothetical protein
VTIIKRGLDDFTVYAQALVTGAAGVGGTTGDD